MLLSINIWDEKIALLRNCFKIILKYVDNFRLCEFSQTNFSSMCSDRVLFEMKAKNKEANHYFFYIPC